MANIVNEVNQSKTNTDYFWSETITNNHPEYLLNFLAQKQIKSFRYHQKRATFATRNQKATF